MNAISRYFSLRHRSLIVLATILPAGVVCLAAADDSSHSLCYLAASGDLQAIRARIERNPELVHKRKFDRTPLHCAAGDGQADIIDYLVSRGAKLEARDEYGRTPLHMAAYHAHPQAIQHLLARGADVNARDKNGDTPLHRAVNVIRSIGEPTPSEEQNRRLEVVKLLIDAGADVNSHSDSVGHRDDDTPLHIAAESNLPRVIEYLVKQGAEVEARDISGKTPLIMAAGNLRGSFEALQTLVRLGADPTARMKSSPSDNEFWNALSLAASRGNLKSVAYLLELDVPIRYGSGSFKYSALGQAIRDFHSTFGSGGAYEVRQVVDQLAIINLLTKETESVGDGAPEQSELNDGTTAEPAISPKFVRQLLKKDADERNIENIKDNIENIAGNIEYVFDGLDTDSWRAVEERQEALGLLSAALDDGEDEKAELQQDAARRNIFELAREGDLEAIKATMERNPGLIETRQYENTLLHYAARGGQVEVIDYLIDKGIDVNAVANLGRTPLHEAASSGEAAAIKRLLDQGAKIDAKDKLGHTPLHMAVHTPHADAEPMPPAEQQRRLEAVKVLIAAGAKVNARSDRERTPLHLAADSNLPDVIEYFVKRGAEIDARGSSGLTPLHWAAGAARSVEALKKLVELGADPTIRMQWSSPPKIEGIDMTYNTLSWAALWGNVEMVKFLLEKDVPARYGGGESEHSALYDAMLGASAARREGADKAQIARHLAVIDLLAEEMGGINAGVKHGAFDGTALEAATAPYVARHLLTEYSEKFTTENIKTAIDELEKKIDSRSRRIRDEPEKTLETLRSALLVYGIFEAKQREENGD